jgi:hypothetical protein
MAIGGSDGLRSSLVKVANGHILEGVLWIVVGQVLATLLGILRIKLPCKHPRTTPTHLFDLCFIQIEIRRDLVHSHWLLASSGTSWSIGLLFSCYSWLLPSPRWLGAADGRWWRLVIVLLLRSVLIVRGIDPTSWSAKGYSSGMLVASWSALFEWFLWHPWWV